MAEFYKFEISNWNEGTANMTLEQEAAYLRVVNAIRLSDQPITLNAFVLGGLWRCNERKAKRLLDELVALGKVRVEGGKIINDKAVEDASNLSRLRADRASAGRAGGIQSGNSRRKSLESNKQGEAVALTRIEEKRVDKREAKASPKKRGERLPDEWSLPATWGNWAMDEGLDEFTVRSEASKFKDYWHSQPSSKGLKADWQATWRNWVRSAIERRANSQQKSNGVKNDRTQFDIAHREYARRIGSGEIHRGPDPSDPFAGGS